MIATSYYQLDNSPEGSRKAINYYQNGLKIAQDHGDELKVAQILGTIGFIYKDKLNDSKKALEFYQQELKIAEKIQNNELRLNALLDIAQSSYNLAKSPKEYQEVIPFAERGLKLAQELKNYDFVARAFAILGLVQSSQLNYQKAIDYYQQGLTALGHLENQDKNQTREAELLISIGDAHDSLKNYQEAVKFTQQGLEIAQKIKDYGAIARAFVILGGVQLSLLNYQEAINYYQSGLGIAQEHGYGNLAGRVLSAIGTIYKDKLSDSKKAFGFFQEQFKIAEKIQNDELRLDALLNISQSSLNLAKSPQEYQEVITFAEQGLKLGQKLRNYDSIARAFAILGSVQNSLLFYQKAIDYYQQGLTALGNPENQNKSQTREASLLIFIGDIYDSLGNYQEAVKFAQQGLEIARQIKDEDSEASALLTLSSAQSSLASSEAEYRKAEVLAQQGLALARKNKSLNYEAYGLKTLSSIADSLSEYDRALDFAQQSLAIYQKLGDPGAGALLTVFSTYWNLGDYKKAHETLQKGLEIARNNTKGKNPKVELFIKSFQQLDLTLQYFVEGDNQAIIKSAQQGITISAAIEYGNYKDIMQALNQVFLAAAYSNLGEYQKAIYIVDNKLTPLLNSPIFNNSNFDLKSINASIYRKAGRREEAISGYLQGLATARGSKIVGSDVYALAGLARAYRESNLPATAITYYKQAVSSLEQVRQKNRKLPRDLQAAFLQSIQDIDRTTVTDIYRELADLLIEQGRIAEAQQIMELLKIRELNDFAKGTRAKIDAPEIEFYKSEKQIIGDSEKLIAFGKELEDCQKNQCVQLSQLESKYQALLDNFNALTKEIEKRAVKLNEKEVTARIDDFSQSAGKIANKPNTILIYPIVLPDKVRLLWMSQGKVRSAKLCPMGKAELGKTVNQLRTLLKTPDPANLDQLQATGKTLYKCLIAPLESALTDNKIQNIVVIPDLTTNYIPLGALFDGKHYLVDRFTFSTGLSARETDTGDRLPSNPQNISVLALGLSDAVSGFNPLPNVPTELDSIVKKSSKDTGGTYPGLELLNQDFTRQSLSKNLTGRNIVHIATHGEFIPIRPKDSYLLLGDGKKYPIYQVQDLDELRGVHLVVLSACQTALGGKEADGTEIAGISSFFLIDRAKAVIASLWNVDDASTSLLMQQFYRNLATGKYTKAEALREAQRSLLNKQITAKSALDRAGARLYRPANAKSSDFSHPYYWAPFILTGNPW